MIRLYRLTTGEDIIGTPVEAKDYPDLFEEDSINHIDYEYLKRPFVLIPMQHNQGNQHRLVFILTFLIQEMRSQQLKNNL